jgi:hypothetical protein
VVALTLELLVRRLRVVGEVTVNMNPLDLLTGMQPNLAAAAPPPNNPMAAFQLGARPESEEVIGARRELDGLREQDDFVSTWLKGELASKKEPSRKSLAADALANFARGALMGPRFKSAQDEQAERDAVENQRKAAMIQAAVSNIRAKSAAAQAIMTDARLRDKDQELNQYRTDKLAQDQQKIEAAQRKTAFEQEYKAAMFPFISGEKQSQADLNASRAKLFEILVKNKELMPEDSEQAAATLVVRSGIRPDDPKFKSAFLETLKSISLAHQRPYRPIPPTLIQLGEIGPNGERITNVIPVDRFTGQPIAGGSKFSASGPATGELQQQQMALNTMMQSALGTQNLLLEFPKQAKNIMGAVSGSQPLSYYRQKMGDNFLGLEAALNKTRTDTQTLLALARSGKTLNEKEIAMIERQTPQPNDTLVAGMKKAVVFNLGTKAIQWRINKAKEAGIDPMEAVRDLDFSPTIARKADEVTKKALGGGDIAYEETDPDVVFEKEWDEYMSRRARRPSSMSVVPPTSKKKDSGAINLDVIEAELKKMRGGK